jgi:hypothetical protein
MDDLLIFLMLDVFLRVFSTECASGIEAKKFLKGV